MFPGSCIDPDDQCVASVGAAREPCWTTEFMQVEFWNFCRCFVVKRRCAIVETVITTTKAYANFRTSQVQKLYKAHCLLSTRHPWCAGCTAACPSGVLCLTMRWRDQGSNHLQEETVRLTTHLPGSCLTCLLGPTLIVALATQLTTQSSLLSRTNVLLLSNTCSGCSPSSYCESCLL